MAVWATSFDGALLADSLRAAVDAGAANIEGLDELTRMLGPEFLAYAFPIAGLGLPKTYAWVGLETPDGVQARLENLVIALGGLAPGLTSRTRDYKVKNRATDERLTFAVTTVEIPKEILDLGPFISISPSFCIVDDRLLVSLKSTDLKRELKRLFGGRDDEAPHALVSRVLAEPEDASSIVLIDWGQQIKSAIDLVAAVGPLFGDLGVDLDALPSGDALSLFFAPTIRVNAPIEGGSYMRHEASFGPESWVAALSLGYYLFTPTPEPAMSAPAVIDDSN
jgi:hypothetical protein